MPFKPAKFWGSGEQSSLVVYTLSSKRIRLFSLCVCVCVYVSVCGFIHVCVCCLCRVKVTRAWQLRTDWILPPKALSCRSHTDMHTPADAPSVIGRFERTQPLIGRSLSLNRSKIKPGGDNLNKNTTNRGNLGKYFHNFYGFYMAVRRGHSSFQLFFFKVFVQEFNRGETVFCKHKTKLSICENIKS